MSRLQKLIRPGIASLVPYSSARDEYALDENSRDSLTLLDANENALGSILGEGLNRYPDPYQRRLKAEIGGVISVNPDFMFLGNGSDEAIDLLIKLFCEPGNDEIILMPPTYGMYAASAAINSVMVQEVSLDERFHIRVEEVLEAATDRSKLLFVCSPNNPTGNVMDIKAITSLAKSFPGYVVVDEAYIDFCPDKSALPLINEYDNLIILRTFSKAWGLAGIRLGIAIAQKEVIAALNTIKPPYNINSLTERAARKALRLAKQTGKFSDIIVQERARLAALLQKCSVVKQMYPSDANFLLVKVQDSRKTYETLENAGIIVRDRSSQAGLENCLRITVGRKEDNDKLYKVLSGMEQAR